MNTGIHVDPHFFDNSNGRFLKGTGNMMKLQVRLDEKIKYLRDFILDHPDSSSADVRDYFLNDSPEDFVKYARAKLFKERKGISHKTYLQYDYCLDLVEKYWVKESVKFGDITSDNIRQLEFALKTEGGLGINTASMYSRPSASMCSEPYPLARSKKTLLRSIK